MNNEQIIEGVIFKHSIKDNSLHINVEDINGKKYFIYGKPFLAEQGQQVKLNVIPKRETKTNMIIYEIIDVIDRGLTSQERAIVNYLASPIFPSIGKQIAKDIVDYFHTDIITILQNDNLHKLYEIKSVPQNKLQKLIKAWREKKENHDIILWLMQFDIPFNLANKVMYFYQTNTKKIISENPYELTKIDGIGFHKADEIGIKMGIPRDSERRIESATVFSLKQVLIAGHCYLTYNVLASKTYELLEKEIIFTKIGECIKNLIKHGTLIDFEGCIYLNHIYYAEKAVATKILAMNQKETNINNEDLDRQIKAINTQYKSQNIELSDRQQDALRIALQNRVSVITGSPGTGKSFVTKTICDLMDEYGIKYRLCAPTGRAAKRLAEATDREALTIHRLIGWQFDGFTYNQTNPLQTDCVIIDESSMVDILLLRHLLDALEENDRIIFIGDYNQLPSVGPGNVLKDLTKSGQVPFISLDKIFRQSETSTIPTIAHEILKGKIPDLPTPKESKGKNCMMVKAGDIPTLISYLKKLITSSLPKAGYDPMDIQVITPMREKALGIKALNPILQEVLNPPSPYKMQAFYGNITYRVGDKVMQLVNDYKKEVFNGDVGFIREIQNNNDKYTVFVEYSDQEGYISYEKQDLDNIQHAFASTTHKCITGDTILINANNRDIITVKELYNSQNQFNVHSLNENNLKIESSPITNVIYNGIKPVWEIITKQGFKITTTINHPFYTMNGWKNLEDLHIGDYIGVARNIEINWDTVVSIEFKEQQDTYDLTVKPYHNFIANGIIVHNSQGAEYDAVIFILHPTHTVMLQRNLLYTGLTRAKKMCVILGTTSALSTAIINDKEIYRNTNLKKLLIQQESKDDNVNKD